MIETLIAAPIIAVVISVGSSLMYLSFAKIWLGRGAREGAVCLITPTTKPKCRKKLERTLEVGLPFGEIKIEKFREDSSGAEVEATLHFPTLTHPIRASAKMPRL